ncbi:MAG: hypothetical protein CMO82_02195 [Winogradskyella sp.]|uniref:Uncharacterized protein n=1 Tax=Winogradskyella poriferorum TaxID=307627 RepID=A0ABU7W2L4_9FLAO|nr:hypothetical protein [Winogradskyella sp.]|tara:strand:+ start:40 stop:246 length:207 start_codon:yes stop_codon:yes gene_type:complete
MDTTQQILTKIAALTREIEDHHPELIKYLDETRSTLPNNSGQATLDNKDLQNYLEQLQSLLENQSSKS